MTLRTRIAAVASLSVALVVLATALGLYFAVRSELRGEIDSALRARTRDLIALRGVAAARAGKALFPRPDLIPRGAFPGHVQPAPLGAASGYVQFISPQGTVHVPGGQGSSPRRIPEMALDRKIAGRGSGSSLTDRSVNGTRLRVLTLGVGSAGAVSIARPLTEVQKELRRLVLILVLIGAGGIL